MQTTIDGLLNRRVMLEQPANGYRVAVDTVLLAASVPAEPGQKIIDLGCGVGGAMLCVACRVPNVILTGVEIQDDFVGMCKHNIARNAFAKHVNVFGADITDLPERLNDIFDHVIMNPPYHDEIRHDVSVDEQKRKANAIREGELDLWIEAANNLLQSSGVMTLIYRADRLNQILDLLHDKFGLVEVLSLRSKISLPPKRIIVRAHKAGDFHAQFCQTLTLHEANGSYTEAVEGVLRHMKPMEFVHA